MLGLMEALDAVSVEWGPELSLGEYLFSVTFDVDIAVLSGQILASILVCR